MMFVGMPRFCSFEDPILCGFQQDKTDGEIDWIVWREATPSALTGPPSDHTCGNERGQKVTMWSNITLLVHMNRELRIC